MTDEQLQEIRARLEGATPRPWVAEGLSCNYLNVDADTRFVAYAPTDIAALLDEVDQLKAYIREITTTKCTNKPVLDAGPYWGNSGGRPRKQEETS